MRSTEIILILLSYALPQVSILCVLRSNDAVKNAFVWRCKSTPLTMTCCGGGGVAAVMSTWARHIRPRMNNVPPRFTYNWWHFNLSQERNNKTRPFMETCRRTAYIVPSIYVIICIPTRLFAGPLISRRSAIWGSFVFNAIRLCTGYLYYSCICIRHNNNSNSNSDNKTGGVRLKRAKCTALEKNGWRIAIISGISGSSWIVYKHLQWLNVTALTDRKRNLLCAGATDLHLQNDVHIGTAESRTLFA